MSLQTMHLKAVWTIGMSERVGGSVLMWEGICLLDVRGGVLDVGGVCA